MKVSRTGCIKNHSDAPLPFSRQKDANFHLPADRYEVSEQAGYRESVRWPLTTYHILDWSAPMILAAAAWLIPRLRIEPSIAPAIVCLSFSSSNAGFALPSSLCI